MQIHCQNQVFWICQQKHSLSLTKRTACVCLCVCRCLSRRSRHHFQANGFGDSVFLYCSFKFCDHDWSLHIIAHIDTRIETQTSQSTNKKTSQQHMFDFVCVFAISIDLSKSNFKDRYQLANYTKNQRLNHQSWTTHET